MLRWLLTPQQAAIYDHIANSAAKIICIEAHRKSGKTLAGLVYALEHNARKPGIACFCTDTRNHLSDIIFPMYNALLASHAPRWQETGKRLKHEAGGEVAMYGADRDNADSMRGPAYNLAIIDEAAYIDDLEYLVNEVLIPTSNETGCKIVMLSSTCNRFDHPFSAYCDRAKADGAYYRLTLDDNADKTQTDKALIAQACGGRESILYRRDYLCERITDPERAALPEMDMHYDKIVVDKYNRPSHYQLYCALDVGFDDCSGYVCGYYDIAEGNYIVDGELLLRRSGTQDHAEGMRKLEQTIHPGKQVYRRVSDTDLRIIYDLNQLYNLNISPTAKDNKAAQIAHLRQIMASGRLKILSSCYNLISQCRSVTWNKTYSGWERTAKGHYDLVDALIYLIRTINPTHDPRPLLPFGVSPKTHALPVHLQHQDQRLPDGAEAFEKIF